MSKSGYRVWNVQLDKSDTIEIEVSQLKSTCKHKMKKKVTFNHLAGRFPSLCLMSLVQYFYNTNFRIFFQGGCRVAPHYDDLHNL